MPPGQRKTMLSCDEETIRLLSLQSHQIDGSIDPRLSLRALVQQADAQGRSAEPRPRPAFHKIAEPEVGRLVNDRLAPGGLN